MQAENEAARRRVLAAKRQRDVDFVLWVDVRLLSPRKLRSLRNRISTHVRSDMVSGDREKLRRRLLALDRLEAALQELPEALREGAAVTRRLEALARRLL